MSILNIAVHYHYTQSYTTCDKRYHNNIVDDEHVMQMSLSSALTVLAYLLSIPIVAPLDQSSLPESYRANAVKSTSIVTFTKATVYYLSSYCF